MKTQKLYCEAGKHWWERPSQRGRRPRHCPEHRDNRMLVAIADANRPRETGHSNKNGRQRRIYTPEEIEQLRARLIVLERDYDEANAIANAAREIRELEAAFDRIDRIQSAMISVSAQLHHATRAFS